MKNQYASLPPRRKQNTLDKTLRALQRCFAYIFAATGIINIIVMVVMKAMISTHTGLLQDLEAAGQRQLLIQAVVTDVQHLMLVNTGYLSPDIENATRAHMRASLADIETLHNLLYLDSESSSFEKQQELYQGRSIGVTEFVGSALVPRAVNLLELGVDFVQQARAVMAQPLTEFKMSNNKVAYLITNGPTVIRSAFNESSNVILDQASVQFAKMVGRSAGLLMLECCMCVYVLILAPCDNVVCFAEGNAWHGDGVCNHVV